MFWPSEQEWLERRLVLPTAEGSHRGIIGPKATLNQQLLGVWRRKTPFPFGQKLSGTSGAAMFRLCADPRLSREFLISVRPKTSQDFRLSLIVKSNAVALVRSLRATESKACDATRSAARSNSSARWIAKRVGIIRQTRRSPASRTRET